MADYKQEAARAALPLVEQNMQIGFGAGSSVAHLIQFLKEDPDLRCSLLTLSTSFTTRSFLRKEGFRVAEMENLDRLDFYFDGCDQFDANLNALKSGGGIHTLEKIGASMAETFVLLGDASKYTEKLGNQFPVVLEVIPQACSFVSARIKKLFSKTELSIRGGVNKDGALISDCGNYLLDLRFENFPEPGFLNDSLNAISGLLEHSLFVGLAKKAIIADENGIRTMEVA